MAEWIFDTLPPSGARRGGDPAEHAFPRNIDSFVREVVQNANDQRLGSDPAEVHFRFAELVGSDLDAFLEKLSWKTLEPHLRAAGKVRSGRPLKRFLDELDHSRRMLLLTVEDRNTVGLTGAESEEESHFRALCKDTLFSHKQSTAAGGSYGLGKSVLWTFSGLSTVLFNSVLRENPSSRKSPRLIGRAELPSHKVDRRWYSGSGWFGQPGDAEGGKRAESIWHLEASLEARDLFLARRKRATGTSILLVGFRDPTLDDEPTVEELDERIRAAAVRWFWPAMEMAYPGLRVRAGKLETNAEASEALRPFVECWRGRASRRKTLERPGDIAARAIPFELPPRREGGKRVKGELSLVVRLAKENERQDLTGHVALFRAPGMVVKYWNRSALAQGMRPFHAILAAGLGRNPRSPTEADAEVESFLRDAEPPGHDDWISTAALKESWKPGYAKALGQLKDRVATELRELLAPRPSYGARGPERLQRRFPVGKRGSGRTEPVAFRFSDFNASFDGMRWRFAGTVRAEQRGKRPWQTVVSLRELGDGGAELGAVDISSIEVVPTDARATIEQGVVHIDAGTGIRMVSFRGATSPVGDEGAVTGELALEVGGKLATESV